MELSICHLYPDVLNLYGDRGNILCMEKRLAWRSISVDVTEIPIGASADFTQFDLFFIGGGQDFEQEVLLDDLARSGKADGIRRAVADGKTFLAICGGYQMLGSYYRTWDGRQCDFIGAVDFHTIGSKTRMIGNYVYQCDPASGGHQVVGFENHSGKTWLGEGVAPLGRVIKGFGNNGEDGMEGCRFLNVFATYSHGPLLPKNPDLCDEILKTALEQKQPGFCLEPLQDELEHMAHASVTKMILT